MPSEPDRIRLQEMLDAARRAIRFAEGRNRADLDDEENPLVHALVRLIAVIGEAAHHVSVEARSEVGEIPWLDVVNMRHRLIHAYFDIDLDILWATVQRSLPELIEHLETHLPEAGSTESDED